MNKQYNGWANRQTWNVILWMNNDYGLYQEYTERVKTQGKFTASTAQQYVGNVFSAGVTPDGDSLSGVNWKEIAKALNE